MNYLVSKYINLLSSQLSHFKRKSQNLYNFRCPYCMDSKRNKRKARGYVYEREGEAFFICHNCSSSRTFDNFLKDQDYRLFCEYIKEKLYSKEEEPELNIKMISPIFKKTLDLDSIESLPESNHGKKYLKDRKIPEKFFSDIYFTYDFKNFVNNMIPNKLEEKYPSGEHRIVIPFYSDIKELIGFTGRTIGKTKMLRYMNFMLDDNKPKLFGMERWDKTKKTYIVEGPLDSLFLPNCLATMGNDMVSALKDFPKDNLIILYDNEPRSPEIKHKIEKAINAGYQVCFWPENIHQKDINDLILSGYDIESIMKMIDSPLKNLTAKLKLFLWSKV